MNRPTLNFGNAVGFVGNTASPVNVPPVPANPSIVPIQQPMPTSSELKGQTTQEAVTIDEDICFSNNAIAQPAVSDIKFTNEQTIIPPPSSFVQTNAPEQNVVNEIKPDLTINENPTALLAPKRRTRKPKAEASVTTENKQEAIIPLPADAPIIPVATDVVVNTVEAPALNTLNPTAVMPSLNTPPVESQNIVAQPLPDDSAITVAPNANLIKTDAINVHYVVEGANQAIKIMAEDTAFTVDTNVFKVYLDKISLNSVIKDAVVSVCDNFLFARYSEPITRYISGLITLPLPANAVEKAGTMIISNLDELIKVMKQFTGQLRIEYTKGKLILTEVASNNSAELLGAASAFVSSMKSAIKLVHDPVAKTLSGINYGAMNNFVISPNDLQSVAAAASAINLDFFTFDITAKQVNTISTNRQKAFKMCLKAKNMNVHTPMQVSFYITLANICKLYKTDLTFYIQQNSMIMTDGVDYYLMLTCGK